MGQPTHAEDAGVLTIAHEIFVPREIIFELWTDAGHLSGWYPSDGATNRDFELDAKPGGAYAFRWIDPDGRAVQESGTIEVLQGPERIAYTTDDATEAQGARVEVALHDLGGKTRIEIRHSGLADGREAAGSDIWHSRLLELESYLSSI